MGDLTRQCNTCQKAKSLDRFETMSSGYVRPMCKSCYNYRRRKSQGGAERQRLHRERRISEEVSKSGCRLVRLFTKNKIFWLTLEYKGFEFETRMASFLTGSRPWRNYKQSKLYVGHYLYRFLDKDGGVMYIGKSSNLIFRLIQHFSSSSMETEKSFWKKDVAKVEALKCISEADMHVLEVYLINKLKPRHNKSEIAKDALSFNIEVGTFKEVWVSYVYDKQPPTTNGDIQ